MFKNQHFEVTLIARLVSSMPPMKCEILREKERERNTTTRSNRKPMNIWVFHSDRLSELCRVKNRTLLLSLLFRLYSWWLLLLSFIFRMCDSISCERRSGSSVKSDGFSKIHYSAEWQANLIILIKRMPFFIENYYRSVDDLFIHFCMFDG